MAIQAAFDESSKASSMLGAKVLAVTKRPSGDAVWIPYHAQASIYGYLEGGANVAMSGPFSGCYFEVGRHEGRLYAAHVSCENKTDPNVTDWLAGKGLAGREVLFRSKVGMSKSLPQGTTNAAAIVFAQIEGGAVKATRVDVQTQSAGGMSGPIFDVQELVSEL